MYSSRAHTTIYNKVLNYSQWLNCERSDHKTSCNSTKEIVKSPDEHCSMQLSTTSQKGYSKYEKVNKNLFQTSRLSVLCERRTAVFHHVNRSSLVMLPACPKKHCPVRLS